MENSKQFAFKTIEELLAYLPVNEVEIMLFLRKIIVDCMPDLKEKLVDNIPFYYLHARICYVWPATIPWDKLERGVAIGFCKGENFLDETFIKTKFVYQSLAEIDAVVLKQEIMKAVAIDYAIVKRRRRRIQ